MAKRIAIVRLEKCKAPKDCPYLCIRVCPPVRAGKGTIVENKETGKIIIEEETCIGCGLCVKKCPFDAITIVNLPEALSEPIQRFGRNGFALYGKTLPFPEKGLVTGFLGPNGCGKSTAVSLLSGAIFPNFNQEDFGKGASPDLAIERFAGQEIQKHFKSLKEGKLRFSTKPQQIAVPDSMKDRKVSDAILGKLDDGAIAEFNLGAILGRRLSELSGGELQRLTIAICYSSDSDIYFFDEPSSFLDIKERIRAASRMRRLAEGKNRAVFLVEHDLTFLDSASDNVILFYGEPSVYGVVSIPKTQRVGINNYLSGFSRDENIRFRNSEIKFSERAPFDELSKRGVLQEFSGIEKALGSFSLRVEGGKIRKGEVVGVLGENGTGKTTLVRILAGEIPADSGKISKKLELSYKPQNLSEILKKSGDSSVREYLLPFISDASDLNFESEVAEPLSLRILLEKRMSELSGGELQRVVVAGAIMKKAGLYLLDEPSAFLDVEQRLAVANFIKKINEKRGAGVLVVDHDILFIDYLADSLMVFSGTPAVSASAVGPLPMKDGMNSFLSDLGVTFRRDPDTKRPRANKKESKLDKEQKATGAYYYST